MSCDPDEAERLQRALQPNAEELKRIQQALQPNADVLKSMLVPLSIFGLGVTQIRALSTVAMTEVPEMTAVAIYEFDQVLDDGDNETDLAQWLRKLAPSARPAVFVPIATALVAVIEYVRTEVGAEPSASVVYLVAALLAIAQALVALEKP